MLSVILLCVVLQNVVMVNVVAPLRSSFNREEDRTAKPKVENVLTQPKNEFESTVFETLLAIFSLQGPML